MFQRIGKKRQAKFLSANEVEEKPDFQNLGVKNAKLAISIPNFLTRKTFLPTSNVAKGTYPFRRVPVQVRSRPGYRYARATTSRWSRRLWTIDARVSLGSCERGAMQTNLHLAASPLKRPFAPSSALRVGVRGLLFSERTTFS